MNKVDRDKIINTIAERYVGKDTITSQEVADVSTEFGFDYLRDNMAKRPKDLVQRKLHYSIVDEVDSVLIDDARTPLIISGPTPQGEKHEYNEFKHKVHSLVSAQKTDQFFHLSTSSG